jgi:hypothetical protein
MLPFVTMDDESDLVRWGYTLAEARPWRSPAGS